MSIGKDQTLLKPLSGKFECKYITLTSRHYVKEFHEHETKQEAMSFLEAGNDNGEHFSIALIDAEVNEMIWHNDLLSEKDALQEVNGFIRLMGRY